MNHKIVNTTRISKPLVYAKKNVFDELIFQWIMPSTFQWKEIISCDGMRTEPEHRLKLDFGGLLWRKRIITLLPRTWVSSSEILIRSSLDPLAVSFQRQMKRSDRTASRKLLNIQTLIQTRRICKESSFVTTRRKDFTHKCVRCDSDAEKMRSKNISIILMGRKRFKN